MDEVAEQVAREVRVAFPALRPCKFIPLVNSTEGNEPRDVAADFEDKGDWTVLDAAWLDHTPRGLASALNFLSDEATCFYIPAFITADLGGRLKRVDPSNALTFGFDGSSRDRRISPHRPETWTDYGTRRWERLAEEQVLAIIHYLEWRIAKDGRHIESGIAEALSSYWYGRLGGR